MLRLFVALSLLVSAFVAAHGDDRFNDLQPLFDVSPPGQSEEETEQRRLEQENWQREVSNGLELQHRRIDQWAILGRVGPAFEIASFGGLGFRHWLVACLIGENGKVYLYHGKNGATAQAAGVVNQSEFSKAARLAKSVGHAKWRPAPASDDFGNVIWRMSFDGQTTLLQAIGDYLGDHPDPRAGELVKLINGWCPYTPEIMSRLGEWETALGLKRTPFDSLTGAPYR